MKIALCISGQLRYLDVGYPYIHSNILSKYDTDVFIHSWWDEHLINQKINFSVQYNRTGVFEEGVDQKALDLYSPVKYVFEPQKEFDLSQYEDVDYGVIPQNYFSQFYSRHKVNDLCNTYQEDNDLVYDLIIRARTDIIFNKFDVDLNEINPEYLHCTGLKVDMYDLPNVEVCNDQFAISNKSNMDVYNDLYNNIFSYYQKYKLSQISSMHPERILTHHLHSNNVPINYNRSLLVDIFKG